MLDHISGRRALLDRVRTLSNSGSRVILAQRFGGRWFYLELENGSDDKKLYTRAEGGTETLLVDPTVLGKAGQHFSLDWFQPSWDGKYVACGVSPGGSEDSTIHVIERSTGKLLPDSIDARSTPASRGSPTTARSSTCACRSWPKARRPPTPIAS